MCPQCEEGFSTASACKTHVRAMHQAEIQINGLPPIHRVDGVFHCPQDSCTYKTHKAHSFHRHSHIVALKAATPILPSTTSVPPLPETSRPATPVPSEVEIEETVDDLRDEDYEPMEIESVNRSRSQELIRPVELQSLQIGIDPLHLCIVCEGCQCGVPRPSLHNHIMQSHGGLSKVPLNLESILDEFLVPREIHAPTSKVIPVCSLPIIPGFMCSVPGCGVASDVEASLSRHHGQVMHSDIPAQDRIMPSLIQIIYPSRREHQVWPVDPTYATVQHGIDYVLALDKIKECDAQGWDDGMIHTPRDPRHMNGFLKEFGWLRITEGKDYKELCSLVKTPGQDCPALLPLKDKVEGYFERIRPMVEGMAPLVLRWINTSQG